MQRAIEEVCKDLDAKIPRDAVSQREGGGGKKLAYLETHYVIDRLNKVFGNLGYSCETVENRQVGTTKNNKGDELPCYVARVRITVNGPNGPMVAREGTGYGVDKSAQNPHEMAAKEAESDALKRAAMKFGMSMGLALYDKSQENVEDEQEEVRGRGQKAAQQSGSGKGDPGRSAADKPASVGSTDNQQHKSAAPVGKGQEAAPAGATTSREELNQLINSRARVVIAQRKALKEDLQKYLNDNYKVPAGKLIADQVQKLGAPQAEAFKGYLEGMING